jgi:hypothetical protein
MTPQIDTTGLVPGDLVPGTSLEMNPLYHEHQIGELAFTGGGYTRSKARRAVSSEYSEPECQQARLCECGKLAWYKGTFGAWRCECGNLYDWSGDCF